MLVPTLFLYNCNILSMAYLLSFLPDCPLVNGRIDHLMIYLIDITDSDKICD